MSQKSANNQVANSWPLQMALIFPKQSTAFKLILRGFGGAAKEGECCLLERVETKLRSDTLLALLVV